MDIAVWGIPFFIFATLGQLIRAIVHISQGGYNYTVVLSLSSMIFLPWIYTCVGVGWANNTAKQRVQYVLGLLLLFFCGPLMGCFIIAYAVQHADDFSWGRTRALAADSANQECVHGSEEKVEDTTKAENTSPLNKEAASSQQPVFVVAEEEKASAAIAVEAEEERESVEAPPGLEPRQAASISPVSNAAIVSRESDEQEEKAVDDGEYESCDDDDSYESSDESLDGDDSSRPSTKYLRDSLATTLTKSSTTRTSLATTVSRSTSGALDLASSSKGSKDVVGRSSVVVATLPRLPFSGPAVAN